MVAGIQIVNEQKQFSDIDTITIYLNPLHQKEYYGYIISLHPKRIIFNPGAENDELSNLALQAGIKPVEACTLVLLNTGQFWFYRLLEGIFYPGKQAGFLKIPIISPSYFRLYIELSGRYRRNPIRTMKHPSAFALKLLLSSIVTTGFSQNGNIFKQTGDWYHSVIT